GSRRRRTRSRSGRSPAGAGCRRPTRCPARSSGSRRFRCRVSCSWLAPRSLLALGLSFSLLAAKASQLFFERLHPVHRGLGFLGAGVALPRLRVDHPQLAVVLDHKAEAETARDAAIRVLFILPTTAPLAPQK